MGIFDGLLRRIMEEVPERYPPGTTGEEDPFHRFRRDNVLPQIYQSGMNCALDAIEDKEFRQKVYEEIKRNPDSFKIVRDARLTLSLFGVELQGFRKAYNKTRRICLWNEMDKGIELDNQGKHQEAIRRFDRAIELAPENGTAWLNKGFSLAKLGKFKDAEKCINKAIKLNPQIAAGPKRRGWLDESGKRLKDMEEETTELNTEEINAPDWVATGASLAKLNRHQDAIACFDKALEIDPRLARAFIDKWASLKLLGKEEEAQECLHRAKEIDPIFVATLLTVLERGSS